MDKTTWETTRSRRNEHKAQFTPSICVDSLVTTAFVNTITCCHRPYSWQKWYPRRRNLVGISLKSSPISHREMSRSPSCCSLHNAQENMRLTRFSVCRVSFIPMIRWRFHMKVKQGFVHTDWKRTWKRLDWTKNHQEFNSAFTLSQSELSFEKTLWSMRPSNVNSN